MQYSKYIAIAILGALIANTQAKEPSALIDAAGFNKVTKEAMRYREKRLVDSQTFLELMEKKGVLLLDTRSAAAYRMKHIKGAKHLNFSDFTKDKLAEVIPSKDTPILIYCNNNIAGKAPAFAMKRAPLALNIPTFINLYGYGYKNVYELKALVPIDDERFTFEGAIAQTALKK